MLKWAYCMVLCTKASTARLAFKWNYIITWRLQICIDILIWKVCFLAFRAFTLSRWRERVVLIGAQNSLGSGILAKFSISIVFRDLKLSVLHDCWVWTLFKFNVRFIWLWSTGKKVVRGREEKEHTMEIEMKWKCFTSLTLGNSVLITMAGEEELSQLQLGDLQLL